MKLPLSVSLISYNEEKRIAETLKSIQSIAKEIILVDSMSSDKTVEIAEQMNCNVYTEEWKGFEVQKNSSLQKCTQDWILCLDCDEIVTDELKQNIVNAIQSNENKSYYLNRKTVYLGKVMNYAWQPDKKLRLVKRDSNPKWIGGDIHESLVSDFGTTLLNGNLLHYSYQSIKHHFNKTVEYAQLSAKSYHRKRKNATIIKLVLNPTFAFFNMYIVKLGFLDGWRGLIAAFSSMVGTFLKYAMLFELKNITNCDE